MPNTQAVFLSENWKHFSYHEQNENLVRKFHDQASICNTHNYSMSWVYVVWAEEVKWTE